MEFNKAFTEKLRSGDRIAQKAVFERLYAPLFRLSMRYLANTAEAEDCLMIAFVKVFRQIDRFEWKGELSLVNWSKRIVVTEALMSLRKRQTLLTVLSDEHDQFEVVPEVFDKANAEEIYSAILELPAGYRTVLNLFALEGYTHKEIGELLNISESTSKTQFMKARVRLKDILDKRTNYGHAKGS